MHVSIDQDLVREAVLRGPVRSPRTVAHPSGLSVGQPHWHVATRAKPDSERGGAIESGLGRKLPLEAPRHDHYKATQSWEQLLPRSPNEPPVTCELQQDVAP